MKIDFIKKEINILSELVADKMAEYIVRYPNDLEVKQYEPILNKLHIARDIRQQRL